MHRVFMCKLHGAMETRNTDILAVNRHELPQQQSLSHSDPHVQACAYACQTIARCNIVADRS